MRGLALCTKVHLLVSEHRRFADRQCLTAMCNQPKQLLRILHIFVAYLTIGDFRFQIKLRYRRRLYSCLRREIRYELSPSMMLPSFPRMDPSSRPPRPRPGAAATMRPASRLKGKD